MLKTKLTDPVTDIIDWVDSLLDSRFGAITVNVIRDELNELRDGVAQLNPVIPQLVAAATIPRTWPGVNLAHQYAGVMRDTLNTYMTRFAEDHAERLSPMQMRVVGRITESAHTGIAHGERLKVYLRYAPLRRAPDQTQVDLRALITALDHPHTELPPAPVPAITANADHLTWVITELLTNAARFTPGEARATLTHTDALTVQVIDDGPGIVGTVQDRLFEPFYQHDPTGDGIGVGLTLARRLTALNGGTLTLTSNPDDGTMVSVRFSFG